MQPGDLVAARFEVERFAGAGGMGAVYRARDRESGAVVAVKVLTGRGRGHADRFAREAEVLRALREPAIVRYVAHGSTDAGELFLAMEWLEGEDLEKLLARRTLSIGESVAVAARVAEALGAAHARGVVHRDIKPSNLFLPGGELEEVKILDFGIARGGDAWPGTRPVTQTGAMVGTPGYMAPEQARGARDLDARADVFSLGCVLFECVTSRPAFAGDHVMAILAKILLEDAPRLGELRSDVPAALDALVSRMLAKDRSVRPFDGARVAAELAALGDLGALPRASPSASPRAITRGEQRLLSVVLASGPARVDVAAPTLADSIDALPNEPMKIDAVAPTLDTGAISPANGSLEEALQEAARPFDVRVDRLLDGSIVATIAGRASATDQAARAARCALALRAILVDAPMALATGRGEFADRFPVGEVIDRAARMVRSKDAAIAPAIRLDELTSGLLDTRFEIAGGAAGLSLVRERELIDTTRTLLGKPTPCVGRERELATLMGIFDECLAEAEPRAVLVSAAAGVGKSRVRHEFLRAIAARGEAVEIWIGRGDPMSAGAPFVMIAPFLRRTAGVLDGEPLEARQRKLAARVSRHVAAGDRRRVTEFLGELVGAPFPDEESVQLRSARRDAIVLGDQMRRAWEDFLMAESDAQPVLIVLEDLHWGDLPSVSYLDAALRVVKGRPWMVLAFARPEIHDLFPKLWAGRGVTNVELGGLTKRAGEKLARSVLGADAPREIVDRVVTQAAGNAFYLEELLRAVAEGHGDALPDTVLAMVQARLEALDPEARRVLRAASVFGQVFWNGAVAALLGGAGHAAAVRESIATLADHELVAELGSPRFPGEAEYAFRHAVVREAAYAMLTEEDRALGHRLAGAWLEASGETDAAVIAEHFDRGGERAQAIAWYRRAAAHALEGNDFAAAIARAERAVICGAGGEILGALRLAQAEAHRWRGELADTAARGEEAMRFLPRGSAAWSAAAGEVAGTSYKLGRLTRVEALSEELRALLASGSGDGAMAAAASRSASVLAIAGRVEEADSLFAAIDALPRAIVEGDPGVRARVAMSRSVRAAVAGDTAGYLELARAAVVHYAESGEARNTCSALSNLADVHIEIGAYAEAEQHARDAAAAATRMGLSLVLAVATLNVGLALARRGALDEAYETLTLAVEAFSDQGDKRLEGIGRSERAAILLQRGDADAAEIEARAAVLLLAANAPTRVLALATLAHVLLARGQSQAATTTAGEAMVLLHSLGAIDAGEAFVRLVHAETLEAAGDLEAARTAIIAARDRLLDRASKITDPKHRASFLERVHENARTLGLALSWSDAQREP